MTSKKKSIEFSEQTAAADGGNILKIEI